MNSGIALGRVLGTEVRVHWTWIPVLAVLSVFFGVGLGSEAGPQWSPALSWATAISTSVLLFASVVAHELAHVAVARRSGIGADVVVVQLLGGPYVMDLRPRTPRQQLRAAAAGPIVSIGLVVFFVLVAAVVAAASASSDTTPGWMQGLDFAAVTLALFNAFLVFVSLIPGYPMDGGQLVHAIAWRRSGDPLKANETVSRIGRFVGYALLVIGAGLAVVFDLLPGLGLMIAGWVLLSSSRMLDRRGVLQSLISGLRVIDAADPGSARVPPQLTLDVFAPEYMGERLGAAALVESGGELLGLISQAQIRRVPKRSWPTTRTDQAMVPIADVPRANPDDDLWPVLETLERSGQDAVLIGSGEPHVVLMTRRSAAMLIHARSQGQQRTQKPTAGLLGLGKRRPPVAPLQPPPPLPPSVPATKADETGHHADAQRTPDQHTDEEERR